MTVQEHVAKEIKRRRQRLEFTQADLARAARIPPTRLNHYEQGRVRNGVRAYVISIDAVLLRKIAVALGCKVDDLLGTLRTDLV